MTKQVGFRVSGFRGFQNNTGRVERELIGCKTSMTTNTDSLRRCRVSGACNLFSILFSIEEQLFRRNVKRFRGGLVFKALSIFHSTLGSRVIKKNLFESKLFRLEIVARKEEHSESL